MIKYQKQRDLLKRKFESGNLGHAYLFSGNNSESIKNFTKEFVKLISCIYHNSHGREICSIGKSGGQICQNCRAIEKENFPDLLFLNSANSQASLKEGKDKMEIDISQIREAQKFLSYKPYACNFKSVIMEGAETMNLQSQNCLLKTLEEPPGNSIIFLISNRPETLLPTVLSRIQHVKFFSLENNALSNEENKILQDLQKLIGSELALKFIYSKPH